MAVYDGQGGCRGTGPARWRAIWARLNIRVNTLVPGWVMTEKQHQLWVNHETEAGDRRKPVPEGSS